jgi:hypothetical protein
LKGKEKGGRGGAEGKLIYLPALAVFFGIKTQLEELKRKPKI